MGDKIFIYIDDDREVIQTTYYLSDPIYKDKKIDWTIVRSYYEFETLIDKLIKEDKFKDIVFISFDNDLGDVLCSPQEAWESYNEYASRKSFREKGGVACARLLVNKCIDYNLPLPDFNSHSQNPVGKENILSLLNQFKGFHKVVDDYNNNRGSVKK